MKITVRKTIAAAIVLSSAFAASAANAAVPAGSSGGPDHVRNTGSDTTIEMHNNLNRLYNGSVGCSLIIGSPTFGRLCDTNIPAVETENYDHDTFVEEYQIGSGNGISNLRISTNTDPQIVGARSSRALVTGNNNTTKENGVSGSSFAKDGFGIVVYVGTKNTVPGFQQSNPSLVSLSIAQIERIFSGAGGGCATDWSQIGNPSGLTGAITPYGNQTGSGTYQAFDALITGDPNACANAIPAPGSLGGAGCTGAGFCATTRVHFENNTAPIDGGTGTDGVVYATANDRGTAITWFSFGNLNTDIVSAGTAKPIKVNNITLTNGTIGNNTYPFVRKLWYMNRKIDVSYSAAPASAVGSPATVAPRGIKTIAGNPNPLFTSQAGATYSFREWVCRNGGHANAPRDYNAQITAAINAAGFVRVSVSADPVSINPVTGVQERCILDNFVGNGAADNQVMPANWNS